MSGDAGTASAPAPTIRMSDWSEPCEVSSSHEELASFHAAAVTSHPKAIFDSTWYRRLQSRR